MILNVGCGGRPRDKACYYGDVRVDIARFPTVTALMDAHFLAFKASVFDKIVCFEVLEHLDSPIKALKEFKRVLKTNGKIIISVPNIWYWRRIVRALIEKQKIFKTSPEIDHKQAWDIYEFHSLAEQVGLKVANVDWLNWYGRKRKLNFLDRLLKCIIPQIGYTHLLLALKNTKKSKEEIK
ncbi:MAG: class I SAM-dependent methyltransferase [Conexivisphaerales archaeon]